MPEVTQTNLLIALIVWVTLAVLYEIGRRKKK